MSIDAYIARKKAGQAARVAAYGSVNAVTPADYTLKQALNAMSREKPKKDKKGDEVAPVEDGATGPIFEEVEE